MCCLVSLTGYCLALRPNTAKLLGVQVSAIGDALVCCFGRFYFVPDSLHLENGSPIKPWKADCSVVWRPIYQMPRSFPL
jgi:hypothetical protein